MTTTAWYLVYTKPRKEQCALENLVRQGFEAFLPRIRSQVRRRGRYTGCIEPMFPRYLFVRLTAGEQDWAPIRSTVGVSHLVRFGTWPAAVPATLVEGLAEQTGEDGVVRDLTPPPVQPGDAVRIIDGVLAGYEGLVRCRSGRERVEVLLNIIGKQATAVVSPHQLAAAQPMAGT